MTSLTRRTARGVSSPYWCSGPGDGVDVCGMRNRETLDAWTPALPLGCSVPATGLPLKLCILEICSGCHSVSTAAAAEGRAMFGEATEVEIFSIDGKPGSGASRTVDVLSYDWAADEELKKFREETQGRMTIFYAHASPPCGPYSSMGAKCRPLCERDLRWGDSVVQRCLELMAFFRPHFWTLESRGPPGLDSRVFMQSLEPTRSTVNYCRYGWQRWKRTSIWTNIGAWRPRPQCSPSNCCEHFREHGRHAEQVRTIRRDARHAALPEQLVREWTNAALQGCLCTECGETTGGRCSCPYSRAYGHQCQGSRA